MEHGKLNGSPLRIRAADTGNGILHLSHEVNKAIKGFWERRGLPEPGCDFKVMAGYYGRMEKKDPNRPA